MNGLSSTDITIIIVNFNTGKLVCDCLDSIPAGVQRDSFRVVVVDNGSEDDSVRQIRQKFPEVEVLENGENLGFAAANNRALEKSRSRYYLLLNSDTVMREGTVDTVLDFMEQNPECGFASPQLLNADGTLQNTAANFPTLFTELGNKSLLRLLFPARYYRKSLAAEKPLEVESLVGASLLVRAEMCAQIGYYDEGYFFFLEETDWCRRGLAQGWKSFLVPQATLYHLQGQTAKCVPLAVRIEYWRSRYRYFRENSSTLVLFVLVSGLLLKNLGNIILNLFAAPFSVKSRHKLRLSLHILHWHFAGCPKRMGLSK